MFASAGGGSISAEVLASDWVEGFNNKARLLAGKAGGGPLGNTPRGYAGIEIAMASGFKTYWRNPGEAGGIPPEFDFSGSDNLQSATVLYPVPHRTKDKAGENIAYKDQVILPVAIVPQDKTKPVTLKVKAVYGVCKDICIPAEAELVLDVPADSKNALPASARAALDHVPRAQDALRDGDPVLVNAGATLVGKPKITITARFPQGDAGADVFLEAPDGVFVPLPERIGGADDGGVAVFEAPLGADVDVAELRGRPLTVTLVSETGASTATFVAK